MQEPSMIEMLTILLTILTILTISMLLAIFIRDEDKFIITIVLIILISFSIFTFLPTLYPY